jgi:hypothetical protein
LGAEVLFLFFFFIFLFSFFLFFFFLKKKYTYIYIISLYGFVCYEPHINIHLYTWMHCKPFLPPICICICILINALRDFPDALVVRSIEMTKLLSTIEYSLVATLKYHTASIGEGIDLPLPEREKRFRTFLERSFRKHVRAK